MELSLSDFEDQNRRDYAQTLSRGLGVLRAFEADTPRMTLTEVAARTGLARAAARRFLLTFVVDGYAATDGKNFWLTPKVLDLGFAYLSTLAFWDQAQIELTEVVRQIGESCSASVLDGDDIVYVSRVAANRIMTVGLHVGSRLPALFSSMGRVMLADLPDAEVERRLSAAPFERLTPNTLVEPERLRDELKTIKIRGYAVTDQELELGLISIAVPLRERSGRVVAAINVSSHAGRRSVPALEREVLPVLKRAARRIEMAIGVGVKSPL
ncbi:beta-ketoadipate pathway transcriptional regulator, PcaR/PcaU/PobR family [Caulobacter sp. AP07]|uniref:IclR family transcriptional regulator domain-containing protein n=1 Tax=Caulobacter sp. AP07 TaxID=1144304 RepID=UPI000271EDEA|nr:IclR family transcriptional regulator C-terminal domain-containing protein [Caulobacter sp. AP07]EJL30818.1 beta-ketoadipate pathway transcriptional regulator, PcaR/PcaU/PobR family [Caulobacter sp. AP07]